MSNGLDDVVAAETTLSDVDGLNGRLVIRADDGAEHTISAGEVHLGVAATAR